MDKRAQGATEYLILLSAVMVIVGSIVLSIYVASTGLGSNFGGKIDNVRDNIIIPGLVGMLFA